MTDVNVHLERHRGVALVILDNPPLNLLAMGVRQELARIAETIAADGAVRAVVIRSAEGRPFSVGSDIREIGALAGDDGADSRHDRAAARARFEHDSLALIEDLPQPVIAAIEQYALGGGLELALACDLRVAGESARLGLPEVRLGLFASGGGTQRLPRVIGIPRAKELMFLGEQLGARDALAAGLVNRVVPDGEAAEHALALATDIAGFPGRAVQAIKHVTDQGQLHGITRGFQLEEELIAELHGSHDAQEGIAAFLEKRQPRFAHS